MVTPLPTDQEVQSSISSSAERYFSTGELFHGIQDLQITIIESIQEWLQIKVNSTELKEADHFKYLECVLTRDGYCTKEIIAKHLTEKIIW